jgi:raffinose/stachyose/melibiose transport system substrate-binding protein
MKHGIWGRGSVAIPSLAAAVLALGACSAGSLGSSDDDGGDGGEGGGIELSYLVDNQEITVAQAEAIAAAFTEANPDITIDVESRPQGADGDNIVKTKLATGEMEDIFAYNSGSLLQALDPATNLVPLTDEEWVSTVDESFLSSVRVGEDIYGAPVGAAMGGGILYNKAVYEELGLEVPTTWDEFMANNEAIKAAGIDPVIQSYGDTWTSQLFVLADFHNILAEDPEWADKYTSNDPSAKYSSEPAITGFERLQEVAEAGYVNADYATLKYEQALPYLAEGKGAHYPILTFALPALVALDEANSENIGFFGQPSDDGSAPGMTLWAPGGLYIPTSTTGEKLEAAKEFAAFFTTAEGCEAFESVAPPGGPYVQSECELPDDAPAAVADMQAYVDAGTAFPALEFVSPVKGPNLEKITVEVGSGITPAADGAARYDEDVKAQAEQLGLEGW